MTVSLSCVRWRSSNDVGMVEPGSALQRDRGETDVVLAGVRHVPVHPLLDHHGLLGLVDRDPDDVLDRLPKVVFADPDVLGRNGRRLVIAQSGDWQITAAGERWLSKLLF